MSSANNLVLQNGTCGENVTWELDKGGTLTISGTGDMDNYNLSEHSLFNDDFSLNTPWDSVRKSIASVIIKDGVTSVGKVAFYGCKSLTNITIPNSVTTIGSSAFSGCKSLTNITIPNSVTTIDSYAFYFCESLTSIEIPSSVTTIGSSAFADCKSLTNITIPNSVTTIGSSAFYFCESLTSIEIPSSVTFINERTFAFCEKLRSVVIENPDCKFAKEVFGSDSLPSSLLPSVGELFVRFSDGELKNYILNSEIWNTLSADTQAKIFLARQGKTLELAYIECTDDSEELGNAILNRISAKSSTKDCNAVANFMAMFSQNVSTDLLHQLYDALKPLKAATKALKTIEGDIDLMSCLKMNMVTEKKLPPIDQKILKFLQIQNLPSKALVLRLLGYYGLKPSDIPNVTCKDGTTASPETMAWLLTAHETLLYQSMDVEVKYEKSGRCPEAEEIIAELDPVSWQDCLRKLAEENLGIRSNNKIYLSYPICRYADETLMAELTKAAPSWSKSSGNFDVFRDAIIYSNTRAAMLFADKYGCLRYYAMPRGTTEDTIRDQFLSDIGIDETGAKVYDLGNQTVTVRLQENLTFIVELPNGKTAKSLPKKGADEGKFAAANADFSAMKKDAKKIVKNRAEVLFQDFLSGRERPAKDWSASYLHNPLLHSVAKLLVWRQGDKTFTLKDEHPIDCMEQLYTIGDAPIAVAHPMELPKEAVADWQKYFAKHSIKQPFMQIWEPVIDAKTVAKERYKGIDIPYFRFINQKKHGIYVEDEDFHNDISIWFEDCDATVDRIDYERHCIEPTHRFEVTEFKFRKYTRQVNHIVGLLDKWTVYGRILKDDVSIVTQLPPFTLAQITDFIKLASENNCINCTAALLEYKNTNFAGYDPMDEFSLDL